jgi:glucose/arabinose dehydrogenase
MIDTDPPASRQPRLARRSAVLVPAVLAAGCALPSQGAGRPAGGAEAPPAPVARVFRTERAELEVDTFADGLAHPWGLAFLPDGRMLVTERPGRLRIVDRQGRLSDPVAGVPAVLARGQGGLLDVAVSPRFGTDRTVFLAYAEPSERGGRSAVARAVLDGATLRDLRVIFRQVPEHDGGLHWGARLAFDRDGHLFVTLGDRFTLRDGAQDLSNFLGKVVRIRTDGGVPADNPFVGRAGARPEIWSYGHRNVQGAALDPRTGRLWIHEHGPAGGDEVNLVLPGRNYGWPVITSGREYGTGLKIGEGTARADVEPPRIAWTPSIAPSGLAYYASDRIPGWRDSLLVGALRGQALHRLQVDGERVVREERMLEALGVRIRDVRVGPDGDVWLLTDSPEGAILRVQPRAS